MSWKSEVLKLIIIFGLLSADCDVTQSSELLAMSLAVKHKTRKSIITHLPFLKTLSQAPGALICVTKALIFLSFVPLALKLSSRIP